MAQPSEHPVNTVLLQPYVSLHLAKKTPIFPHVANGLVKAMRALLAAPETDTVTGHEEEFVRWLQSGANLPTSSSAGLVQRGALVDGVA